MSHQAQEYILNNILPSQPNLQTISDRYLNGQESITLSNCLQNDATSYIYSATVSIGNAIYSLNQKLSTWATVQLYYSTFYAFRGLLAIDKICIFYIEKKPYVIQANPGQAAQRKKGQTHKIVLEEFKQRNQTHLLLSLPIEYKNPLEWLMEKRENANYKTARFCEPNIPSYFEKIVRNGLRLAIKDYLTDSSNQYLFDPDHAMVAYPLKVIQIAHHKINTSEAFPLERSQIQYLCKLFQDALGPIPEMQRMLTNS